MSKNLKLKTLTCAHRKVYESFFCIQSTSWSCCCLSSTFCLGFTLYFILGNNAILHHEYKNKLKNKNTLSGSSPWAATGGMDQKLIVWDLQHSLPRCTCDHEVSLDSVLSSASLSSLFYSIMCGCVCINVYVWSKLAFGNILDS